MTDSPVPDKKAKAAQWRYEIVHRVFVKWGYGPRRPDSVIHVDRLRTRFNHPLMYFSFELPEKTKNSPAPQEYERGKTFGWRLVSTTGHGSIGWYLADTHEQAKANMERFIAKHYGREAITLVRKYKRADLNPTAEELNILLG